MPEFSFDEIFHVYKLDGHILPSVTQILGEWHNVGGRVYYNTRTGIVIPAGTFETAQDRGSAVHKILELCLTGQGVDKTALDSSLLPYLKSIEDFINDYLPSYTLVEKPLCDEKKGYAGTPDFFGEVKGTKNRILFDAKTGMAGRTDIQTSAYENLVRVETKYRGNIDRYLLSIKPEGYTFHKVGTPQDFTYFLLKLKIYQIEGR